MRIGDDDWIDNLVGTVFMAIASVIAAIAIGLAGALMGVIGLDKDSFVGWLIFLILAFVIFGGITALLIG